MRTVLCIIIVVLFTGCRQQQPPSPFAAEKIVDLSYTYDSTTVYWPTEQGFRFEKGSEGMTPGGYFYTANRFWTPEHGGTHIDAPIHFYEGHWTVDQIPLDRLVGPGIVVDVSSECAENPDYQIQIEDFLNWETKYGQIPSETIVLLKTGYGSYWPDRVRYMGTDERGSEAVAKLHFPGLHPDAAKWLANERTIKAVGLDTPSIDYGQSSRFQTHVALFERNIPAFENVANLNVLPHQGFTVIALPMKIKGGSGGPLRIIALLQ